MCQPGEDACPVISDQPLATGSPTLGTSNVGFIGDLLTDEPTIDGEITINDPEWWFDGEDIDVESGASGLPLLFSCIVLVMYTL